MTSAGDLTKRVIDLVAAALALVVLSPVLAAVALIIRRDIGSPVLHRSQRAGRHGRPFTLLKLRTMTEARDEAGRLLPDDERLSVWGRRLRSTSLDELPQLWNILRGDMSLVGPRPLPVAYLPRYRADEARRHDVRPGITGWAQVHGRNAVGWDERLAHDAWYAEHHDVLLDVRILWRTVGLVLRREGIAGGGEATMAELRPELGMDEVSIAWARDRR